MVEALGMRLTLPAMRPAALEQANVLLDTLDEMGGPAAGAAWHRTHHEFHQTSVPRAAAVA